MITKNYVPVYLNSDFSATPANVILMPNFFWQKVLLTIEQKINIYTQDIYSYRYTSQ